MDRQSLTELIVAAIGRSGHSATEAHPRKIADTVLREIAAARLDIVDATGQSVIEGDGSSEKRREKRERTLKHGTIIHGRGSCVMDCVVLDLTDGGARLKPADIMLCPQEFSLKIQYGSLHNCDVIWRKNTELGVRFR